MSLLQHCHVEPQSIPLIAKMIVEPKDITFITILNIRAKIKVNLRTPYFLVHESKPMKHGHFSD